MRSCILITKEYPYYRGETFIESEINYLCKAFDRVYIYAITGNAKDRPTRYVPDNCLIIPLSGLRSKWKYIFYTIHGIRRPHKDLKLRSSRLGETVLELYCRGRAERIAKQICKDISSNNREIQNVVLYSYWFDYQSLSAWMVGEQLGDDGNAVFCVSRAHGYDLYWYRNVVDYLPFQDVSLKHLDFVCPCSDNGTLYLSKKYSEFKDKIVTARLGTMDFGINENPESGKIVLLTCCNMDPVKRMPLFAKAFVLMQKTVRNCKWICIGDGPDSAAVKAIIDENDLDDQVAFEGYLSNAEVMRYYQHHSISYFCNVSESEGLPVSVMEALSFGIPVIATDVGGTKELVDETVGNLLPSDLTAEQLSDQLLIECNLPWERHIAKRTAARNRWSDMASADVNYRRWMDILVARTV